MSTHLPGFQTFLRNDHENQSRNIPQNVLRFIFHFQIIFKIIVIRTNFIIENLNMAWFTTHIVSLAGSSVSNQRQQSRFFTFKMINLTLRTGYWFYSPFVMCRERA